MANRNNDLLMLVCERLGLKGPPERPTKVRCPFHDDRQASMVVFPEGNAHCHSEDKSWKLGEIADQLGLRAPRAAADKKIVKEYDYRDEDGELLYQVVRYEPKDFRQRRPHPSKPNEWLWRLDRTRRVLYRLPELMGADAGAWIFVVEGEKDADTLWAKGIPATSNVGGANKWLPDYTPFLKDRLVAVIADNDAPGRKHAHAVCSSIKPLTLSVRMIELPVHGEHWDVTDWFDEGHGVDELQELVNQAPDYIPGLWNGNGNSDDDPGEGGFLWVGNRYEKPVKKIIADLKTHGKFIDGNGTSWYFDDRERRLFALKDDPWLSVLLHEDYSVNPQEPIFKYLQSSMGIEAMIRGDRATIHYFSHYDEERNLLFVDQGAGRMLRLDGKDITQIDNGTEGVLFTPAPDSEPWEFIPSVHPGHEIGALLRNLQFANAEGENPDIHTAAEQHILFMLWLYSLPFATVLRSKPLALATGPAGSGKTSLWRRVGMMIFGPEYEVDSMDPEREGVKDFFTAVSNLNFVAYDNVDQYIPWLEDALAVASTGQRKTKRELYTTNRATSFRGKAFIALTARTPRFKRDDIAQRLVIFWVDRLRDKVIPEYELVREVQANRDALMSSYVMQLNRVVAMQDRSSVDPSVRLADFASLATRVGRGLGLLDSQIANVITKLTRAQHSFAAEDNDIRMLLEEWIDLTDPSAMAGFGENSGRKISTPELFRELKHLAEEDLQIKFHIANPVSLGRQLQQLEDPLTLYFDIEHGHGKEGNWWQFKRVEESAF